MQYFTADALTPEALVLLQDYDVAVRRLLPPAYRWNIRARDWELLPVLRRPPVAGSRVLDTGAFNTFLGVWLSQYASEVRVTDLLAACLKSNVLRRLGLWRRRSLEAPFEKWWRATRGASPNIKLQSLDLISTGFANDSFDYITCISVLEHIPDYRRAIAELHRILRPGGRLIITTDCSPQPVAFSRGAQSFSPAQLDEIFAPFPTTSPAESPDFSERNWCYDQGRPILTASIELTK